MTDPDPSDKMQKNSEAPLGCLKPFPCGSQENGNTVQEFPNPKSELNTHPVDRAVQSYNSLIRENSIPPNEGYNGPFFHQKFCMLSNLRPEKLQFNRWSAVGNQFYPVTHEYPFPLEPRIPCVPFRMVPTGFPHDSLFQEFQYFVVIDFEATCDQKRAPYPQEIIEFPSVLVNTVTGQLEASFQTYVRPIYHQLLTDFCKELTGIQQLQVDRGVPLSEALLMHDKWLEEKGIKHTNFAVVTWGDWDCKVMLESECKFKKIRKPPYFNRWINLKATFGEIFGGVRCNLKQAVELAGLVWEGRPHCGLDDARNTARLLTLLMHQGIRFTITNSLTLQSADRPSTWRSHPNCVPVWHPYPNSAAGPLPRQHLKQLADPDAYFYPAVNPTGRERHTYCLCGVMSSKRMVRKPGPKHGMYFFGCGNWSATRGASCQFFEWAS